MTHKPSVLAVSGVKNSGKTTLIQRVLPHLTKAGLRVAVVKHDGHRFLPEPPTTDTGRCFAAGAFATAIFDGEKYKIVEQRVVEERELIAHFPTADLILLEGFKHSVWPKLELIRKGNSSEAVCDPGTLLALVTDTDLRIDGVPVIPLDDVEGITKRILRFVKEDGPWLTDMDERSTICAFP